MPTFAIVCEDNSTKALEKHATKLDELMDDHSTRFLVSDTNTIVLRLLHKRGFRSVTIYHSTESPYNPGGYATKSFSTNAECIASMMTEADSIIEIL